MENGFKKAIFTLLSVFFFFALAAVPVHAAAGDVVIDDFSISSGNADGTYVQNLEGCGTTQFTATVWLRNTITADKNVSLAIAFYNEAGNIIGNWYKFVDQYTMLYDPAVDANVKAVAAQMSIADVTQTSAISGTYNLVLRAWDDVDADGILDATEVVYDTTTLAGIVIYICGTVPGGDGEEGVAGDFAVSIDEPDAGDEFAPGDTVDVAVNLKNNNEQEDLEDITVKAWIEDDKGERITDKVTVKESKIHQDDDEDVYLTLQIPTDSEQDDDYMLIVEAKGEFEDSGKVEASDSIKIEVTKEDHSLIIDSAAFSTYAIAPGGSIDVQVNILNNGLNDEEDITVAAEIISLGVTETVTIFEIKEDESYPAYFTLDIPADARAGKYTVKISVGSYDTFQKDIEVTGVAVAAPAAAAPAAVATLGATTTTKDAPIGVGSVFEVTVTNNADAMKSFSFSISGTEDWATYRIDPAITTLESHASKSVYLYIVPKEGTEIAEHVFSMYVKEGETTVNSIQLTANVLSKEAAARVIIKSALTWALAIIIIVAVILFGVWFYTQKGASILGKIKPRPKGKEPERVYY